MLLFKATCIAFSVCFIGSCISWESNPWPWRSAVWAKEECGRKLALIMLVLLHRSIKEPAPLHLSNLISTLLKKWNDNRLCCLLNVWRHACFLFKTEPYVCLVNPEFSMSLYVSSPVFISNLHLCLSSPMCCSVEAYLWQVGFRMNNHGFISLNSKSCSTQLDLLVLSSEKERDIITIWPDPAAETLISSLT